MSQRSLHTRHLAVRACPREILTLRHGQSFQNAAVDRKPLDAAALAQALRDGGVAAAWKLAEAQDRSRGLSVRLAWKDADVPLSPLGEMQATQAGEGLFRHDLLPDVIAYSTHERTHKTAVLCEAALFALMGRHIPLVPAAFMIERNEGELDGIPRPYVPYLFPDTAREYDRAVSEGRIHSYTPPDGESFQAMKDQRMAPMFPDFLAQYAGLSMLLVAHGAALAAADSILTGSDLASIVNARLYRMPNCALTRYGWNEQRGFYDVDPAHNKTQAF